MVYEHQTSRFEVLDLLYLMFLVRWVRKGFSPYLSPELVENIEGKWVISDVRMGLEPSYVFQFVVADDSETPPRFLKPTRFNRERDIERLKSVFPRILDESIEL